MPMIENAHGAQLLAPNGVLRIHRTIGGVCVCPTASGAPRLIRLFDSYEVEDVMAQGTAQGAPPVLPAVTDAGENRSFLNGERALTHAAMTNDGKSHIWHATVCYSYVLLAAEGINSEMPGARLAEDRSLTIDRENTQLPNVNLPPAVFVTGMLGQPPE